MDNRSKGFAYVEFADVESLKAALDLHGTVMHIPFINTLYLTRNFSN
jgi:RNA recognition motif-containing protein